MLCLYKNSSRKSNTSHVMYANSVISPGLIIDFASVREIISLANIYGTVYMHSGYQGYRSVLNNL